MSHTVIATCAMRGSLDGEQNLERILSIIDEAADAGADLIVFPEISLQGYPFIADKASTTAVLEEVYRTAESVPDGPRVRAIEAKAISRRIHVAYGLTEAGIGAGVVFDTAVLTGPSGHIGRYRKVHLTPSEQVIWRPGNDWPVFETAIGRIGLLICYDKTWPESCRELTLRGAELLVMPTAYSYGRVPANTDPRDGVNAQQYQLFDRARAAENQRWLVSSNYVGNIGRAEFFGLSQIIDPLGRVIASTGFSDEGLVMAEIDVRGGIADAMAKSLGARALRDRRSDTYLAIRGEIPIAIDG
ncbi:carbon-nitrogen hydrolase family protein [Microbacterium sp. X-17]|uniref:carbon-nitrogen hydrolase family protein n=1 Tax=Microbacterium sp. X-17 TaxID=3144404 RepID=UPI0031F4869E